MKTIRLILTALMFGFIMSVILLINAVLEHNTKLKTDEMLFFAIVFTVGGYSISSILFPNLFRIVENWWIHETNCQKWAIFSFMWFRKWAIFSFMWAIISFSFVMIFDPFEVGGFSGYFLDYYEPDTVQYLKVMFIMFVPPVVLYCYYRNK